MTNIAGYVEKQVKNNRIATQKLETAAILNPGFLIHQTAPDPNVTNCKPQLKLIETEWNVMIPDYNEIALKDIHMPPKE